MQKLTAEKCRKVIEGFKWMAAEGPGMSIRDEYDIQAYEIALPILERQEMMSVPAFYVVYHPNPNPNVNDDKEYCECGSIYLARKLAAKIGGTIRPVYVGPKMEPERATNQNGEQ